MGIIIKWFLSRTVRHATAMERHVRKIMRAQSDVLAPQAVDAVAVACADLRHLVRSTFDKKQIEQGMDALEKTANKWLQPYPFASIRDNLEVFLVAIAVAMGIRTFLLQPFKIPTGSMQPTLYGVTDENYINNPNAKIPGTLDAFYESWIQGVSYYHVVCKGDGELQSFGRPVKLVFFNLKQTFYVGNQSYTVWFPPDDLPLRAGLTARDMDGSQRIVPKTFKTGEDIMKIKVRSGDYLFVDRMTYNFRKPERGEVIVFETQGIMALPQNQFYIKRMVALNGDQVSIGDDRHLVIDGKRLDASTPHFERVYGFDPNMMPQKDEYCGHVNGTIAAKLGHGGLAANFPDATTIYKVPKNHYMAMGDNTLNSSDSRNWGDFSRENVIGKSFFVYWPISKRFGWEHLATGRK